MRFPEPLLRGTLLRRYKRFLADVRLDGGREITAHTANTGRMLGCSASGSRCWVSVHDNPRRKLKHTLEIVEAAGGVLVGVNTARANALAEEALRAGLPSALAAFSELRREVRFEDSRFDVALDRAGRRTWVEVKNVTLVEDRVALFPDAVTERGRKHLDALVRAIEGGECTAMIYVVQRGDGASFAPAARIDPAYADAFRRARDRGVGVHALQARVSPTCIEIEGELPLAAPGERAG